MKKLLLFSLLIPFTASAQVEISALGGASFNIGTRNDKDYQGIKKSNLMPYGSLKIAYLHNGFAFGASADLLSIKHSAAGAYYDPKTNSLVEAYFKVKPLKPGINTSIFANRLIEQSNSAVYFGLNVGYMFSLSSGTSMDVDPSVVTGAMEEAKGSSSGVTFGLQVGYTYSLTDHLKLKAEFAPRYYYSLKAFGEKDHQHTYNTIILPVAVGLSFVL